MCCFSSILDEIRYLYLLFITYHNSSAGLSSSWLWQRLLSLFGELSFSLIVADEDEEDDEDAVFPSMTGQIFKYSETLKVNLTRSRTLTQKHTRCYWSRKLWQEGDWKLTVLSVEQKRKRPQPGTTWYKKQEVTMTNASAEWRVPLWLVAALFWGFAQLVCFSFPVSFGAFGVVHSSSRPLSVFTVTRGGGKTLSCSLSCCL